MGMIGSSPSQDLGNGARPRHALGVKNPIWRLGALVSLPLSHGKEIMVARPDRSLLLKQRFKHAQRKRFSATWPQAENRTTAPDARIRSSHPKDPRCDLDRRVPRALKPKWNVKVFGRGAFFGSLPKTSRSAIQRLTKDEPKGAGPQALRRRSPWFKVILFCAALTSQTVK